MKHILVYTSFVDDRKSLYTVASMSEIQEAFGEYVTKSHQEAVGSYNYIYDVDSDSWIVIGNTFDECKTYMIMRWLLTKANHFDSNRYNCNFETFFRQDLNAAYELLRQTKYVTVEELAGIVA